MVVKTQCYKKIYFLNDSNLGIEDLFGDKLRFCWDHYLFPMKLKGSVNFFNVFCLKGIFSFSV